MNRLKKTFGIMFVLLITTLTATNAAPVMVVAGNLTNAEGQPVKETFTIRVTNETRGIEAQNHSSPSGEYAVSLVAKAPDETTIAEAGDQLRVSALNADGKIAASQTYQLKPDDIAAAHAVVNLAVEEAEAQAPAQAPPIPVLVVSGVVKDAGGKPIGAGLGVEVINTARQLTAPGATDATGGYVVTLAAVDVQKGLVAAGVDETISVTVKDNTGKTLGSKEHTLTVDDIRAAHVSVDVTIEDKLRFITIGDKPADPAKPLPFEVAEGVELRLRLVAAGGSGKALTYGVVEKLPPGANLQGDLFTWTPGYDTVTRTEAKKNSPLTFTVTDGVDKVQQAVQIQVSHTNRPPRFILIGNQPANPSSRLEFPVRERETLQLTLSAEDGDTDPLTYSVSPLPKDAQLTGNVFTWTPGNDTVTPAEGQKPFDLTLTVSDGQEKADQPIRIQVSHVEPPTFQWELTPSPIEASESAKITVTLRKGDGTPVSNTRLHLTITEGDQLIEIDTGATNAQGQVTVTAPGLTKAGEYTVTARILPNGPTLEEKVLTVKPGKPATVELVGVPKKVERGESVTLSVRVADKFDNPISDAVVQMKTDLGEVKPSPAEPKGDGLYTATFRSEKVGTATIQAVIQNGPSDTEKIDVVDTRIHPPITGQIRPQQLKAGDRLTVTTDAEPDGVMTFTIGGAPSAQKLPMKEVSSGHYEGSYLPPDEIEEVDQPVTLFITDAAGNLGELTLVERVTIDTIPPPAPTELRVDGGEITLENVSNVMVTARATPNRTVLLKVTAVSSGKVMWNDSSAAGTNNVVTWKAIDASNWPDGKDEYTFEAYEEADAVGNPGKSATLPVSKDTRPPGPVSIRVPRFSPEPPVPYNTAVEMEVTLVFRTPQPPKEPVEVEVTLRPQGEGDRKFSLPLTREDPKDWTFQTGRLGFTADVPVVWEYVIVWPGDKDFRPVERSGSFEVVAAEGELSLEVTPNFIKSGQPLTFSGKLTPNLANQTIQVQAIRPGQQAWEQLQLSQSLVTSSSGRFGPSSFIPDTDGVWQFRAVWAGLQDAKGRPLYARTVSPTVEITLQFPFGKVVIAVGGAPGESYWKGTFFRLGQHVYEVFHRRGIPKENIRFLSPAPTEHPTDIPISKETLEDAILNWGTTDLQPNENLYIYLLSDNLKDAGFILERGVFGVKSLSRSDVHQWLEELNRRKVNVVFIMEACYSGEYIQPATQSIEDKLLFHSDLKFQSGLDNSSTISEIPDLLRAFNINGISLSQEALILIEKKGSQWRILDKDKKLRYSVLKEADKLNIYGKPRRFLITSASARTQADIIRTDSFTRRFFNRLQRREDFKTAFEETTKEMSLAGFRNVPQVDADGDGIPNEREEDLAALEQFFPGDPRIPAVDEPNIIDSPSQILTEGVHKATIEAFIRGLGVTASAVIFSPGQRKMGEINSWLDLEGDTIALVGDENTGYRGVYDQFTKPGIYTIFINAENKDGSAIPFKTTVTVPGPPPPPWDVNSDGVVNVFDFVRVASQFGQSGPNLSGDVNRDGTVNVFDLVIVGQHFGETASVPAAPGQDAQRNAFTSRELTAIQNALAELEGLANPPQVAIEVLRAWLERIVPKKTQLLPNYPNPFNPETWIPYQLASDADVQILIYDITGALVRQLELGHQGAGYYHDRHHAAYWDGRNAYGEAVASGVYFYQLRAGDFTATRRMVILK